MAAVAMHVMRQQPPRNHVWNWLVVTATAGLVATAVSFSPQTRASFSTITLALISGNSASTSNDLYDLDEVEVTNSTGRSQVIVSRSIDRPGFWFMTPTQTPECTIGFTLQNEATCYVKISSGD